MAEYIEHQALTLKNLEKYMTVMKVNTREYGNQTVVAVDDLMYLPTADVAEVKHGFWEQGDYYDMGDVCSECQYDSCCEPCKYNYCPNCGARMDSEGE